MEKLHKVLLIKQKNLLIDGQLYRKIKLDVIFSKSQFHSLEIELNEEKIEKLERY